MPDFDVVIVGGGPAGLTAGATLSRAGHRVVVLERELFGGNLQHAASINDYPPYPDGITGAQLAAALIEEATAAGASLEQAEMSTLGSRAANFSIVTRRPSNRPRCRHWSCFQKAAGWRVRTAAVSPPLSSS